MPYMFVVTHVWRSIIVVIRRLIYIQNAKPSRLLLRNKLIRKCTWKGKGPWVAKTNLTWKNGSVGLTRLYFKMYFKSAVAEAVWCRSSGTNGQARGPKESHTCRDHWFSTMASGNTMDAEMALQQMELKPFISIWEKRNLTSHLPA